jgi:hypothetical protein
MFALLLALAAPAQADDDRLDIELHAGVLARPELGYAAGNARLLGRRDAFLEVDGRLGPDGGWLGRAGIGVDVLGGGRWHLQPGVYLGGAGRGAFLSPAIFAGPQLGWGFDNTRVYARASGFLAPTPQGLYGERSFTLGFRVVDEWRVYGRLSTLGTYRGERESYAGFGVGLFL